jgi:hypothetical protein
LALSWRRLLHIVFKEIIISSLRLDQGIRPFTSVSAKAFICFQIKVVYFWLGVKIAIGIHGILSLCDHLLYSVYEELFKVILFGKEVKSAVFCFKDKSMFITFGVSVFEWIFVILEFGHR